MLKLNGKIILNALDLQDNFYPWELYRQLDDMYQFAKVHCQKIAVVLSHPGGQESSKVPLTAEGKYAASYLNMEFWLNILEKGCTAENWSYPREDAKKCFYSIVKEFYQKPEQKDALLQEIEDDQIEEKLQHIISSGGLTVSPKDVQTTVILLALCKLAGVDVLSQSFHRREINPPTQRKPKVRPEDPKQTQRQEAGSKTQKPSADPEEQETVQVEKMPDVGVLRLETNATPYRFFYYDQERLESGMQIRTVRLEAIAGRDRSKRLTVQIVHPKSNQVILSAVLNIGDFRDCNVVDGRVIKFLPTMSISEDLCVIHNQKTKQLDVIPYQADPWTVTMDEEEANTITCVAAGDDQRQGFLCITGGKILTDFYKPCEDYFTRIQLQIIPETIVEADILPDGYRLLTSDGNILSDMPIWDGKRAQVSLTDVGRKSDLTVSGLSQTVEAVLGADGHSLAARNRQGERTIIFAKDPVHSIELLGGQNMYTIREGK